MRACVLHGLGNLRCQEWPTPSPAAGEARVRVSAVGICGSDIPRTYTTGAKRFPLVLGHEIAGVVDLLGPNTPGPEPGTPVVVQPMLPILEDPYVKQGLAHLANEYDYIGSRRDGGMAEYVVAPVRNLYPVPRTLDFDHAALVEPTAVALHALRQGRLRPGMSCCFVGVGPIALLGIQWAVFMGADPVLAVSRDSVKLKRASDFGAEAQRADSEGLLDWVHERTGGLGADLVVEGAGVEATIALSFHVARKRGRIVLLGNPPGDISLPQYDYWQVVRRELEVVGTWNAEFWRAGDDWECAIAALDEGRIEAAPLITDRVSLEKAPEAIAAMRESRAGRIKTLVLPWEGVTGASPGDEK